MNTKRTKRLYCPAMTDSLSSNSNEFNCTIPLKKRKINLGKVEEIISINTQASKLLNIQVLKENSNLNFSFVNSANNSLVSSSVSSLTKDLNKIKIQKPQNPNQLKSLPSNHTILKPNFSNLHNKEKNLTKTIPRNFSLSELNTETRSNFKNIFQEIIKNTNQTCEKRSFTITSNKVNSSSSTSLSGFGGGIQKDNFKSKGKNIFGRAGGEEKNIFSSIKTPDLKREYTTPKFNDIVETPNFKQIEEKGRNNFPNQKNNLLPDSQENYFIPNKKIQVNIFKTKLKYNN